MPQSLLGLEAVTQLAKPRCLFDCLHGLRSQHRQRQQASLKQLSYLIRSSCDLPSLYDQLFLELLRLEDRDSQDEKHRRRALAALLAKQPQVCALAIEQLIGQGQSLGCKHQLLRAMRCAITQLSSNPKLFPPELELGDEKPEVLRIERVKTTYTGTVRPKTRTPPATRLKTLRRAELLINQPFINRFHGLLSHFYFPLLIKLPLMAHTLRKEPLLAQALTELVQQVLDCTQNCLERANVLDSALDFL